MGIPLRAIWMSCKTYGKLVCQVVALTLTFLVMNACYWLVPKLYYRIAREVGERSRMAMVVPCPADYSDYLVTWQGYKVILKSRYEKTKMQARLNCPAISVPVVSPDTGQKLDLLTFADPERPLVVSFGSVTCPIYQSHIPDFNDLVSRCADDGADVNFVIVYIQEGHADDEWRLANARHVIKQHRTLDERLAASRVLRERYHVACPVVADCMDNAATRAYGANPMRLFVIENGIVSYVGGPGPFGYDVHDVEMWLEKRRGTKAK